MLSKQIAACAFRGSLFPVCVCERACVCGSPYPSGQLLCSYDAGGLCDVRVPLGCLFFSCTVELFILVLYLLKPQCLYVKCSSA